MGVFDVEFLTLLLSSFVIQRIDPVINLCRRLLSGLHIYLHPPNEYLEDAIKPLPKNCEDKDAAMNEQIREVPHKVDALLKLGERDMDDYYLSKLQYYDYFWCLVYLLGINVIVMAVVCIRTFIFGYSSSHLYMYSLLLLCGFSLMILWHHIQESSKQSDEWLLLFFYFVFAFIYALCLLCLPSFVLSVSFQDLLAQIHSHISSLLSQLGIHSFFSIPSSLLAVIFAFLLALIPPLLVESAFRFAQLELRKGWSVFGILASHLPLVILLFSIPGLTLTRYEGKMIHGVLIDSGLYWTIRVALTFLWCLCRIIEFRPLLQTYLNGGCSSVVREAIETSMIESIRASRYKPGTKPAPPKFPSGMYQIPKYICIVALQLMIPVVIVVSLVVMSIGVEREEGVTDWILHRLHSFGLPLYDTVPQKSGLIQMCQSYVKTMIPNLDLNSLHILSGVDIFGVLNFLFVFVLSSYYFLQIIGHLYWRTNLNATAANSKQ
ncbi:hypothetical protein WA171_004134 [Blastocystis sp. BT1]